MIKQICYECHHSIFRILDLLIQQKSKDSIQEQVFSSSHNLVLKKNQQGSPISPDGQFLNLVHNTDFRHKLILQLLKTAVDRQNCVNQHRFHCWLKLLHRHLHTNKWFIINRSSKGPPKFLCFKLTMTSILMSHKFRIKGKLSSQISIQVPNK